MEICRKLYAEEDKRDENNGEVFIFGPYANIANREIMLLWKQKKIKLEESENCTKYLTLR